MIFGRIRRGSYKQNRSYMIQRIQTLYLLLVVVLTGLALWLPLADFTVGADTCTLTAFGLKDAAGITLLPTVYLGVVLVAACLVPLVTIFLFKRRLVQIRLCAVELVLLIGAGAMMGIYFYLCNRYFADSEFTPIPLKFRSFSRWSAWFSTCWLCGRSSGTKSWCGRSTGFADRTYFSEKRRAVKTARLLCLFCRERIRFGGVFDTK